VEANSTGGQGLRRTVAPSDDDDDDDVGICVDESWEYNIKLMLEEQVLELE
jgi:hypothetical protein